MNVVFSIKSDLYIGSLYAYHLSRIGKKKNLVYIVLVLTLKVRLDKSYFVQT